MSFAKIKGRLTSRIGALVRFGAPKDVHEKGGSATSGKVVDEVWAIPLEDINSDSPHGNPCTWGMNCWGDYAFCSQLIEWLDGTYSIRLAYYRRRCGEDWWEYASQMTVNSDCQTIKQLLERTLTRTAWFRGSWPGREK